MFFFDNIRYEMLTHTAFSIHITFLGQKLLNQKSARLSMVNGQSFCNWTSKSGSHNLFIFTNEFYFFYMHIEGLLLLTQKSFLCLPYGQNKLLFSIHIYVYIPQAVLGVFGTFLQNSACLLDTAIPTYVLCRWKFSQYLSDRWSEILFNRIRIHGLIRLLHNYKNTHYRVTSLIFQQCNLEH